MQIIAGGDVVGTHVRAEKGRRTNFDHYPPEKIAFHMRTPTWCRKTAAEVGPACEQVIAGLLVDNALFRLRAAQGVLGLREKHNPARLEAACARATAVGDPSYRLRRRGPHLCHLSRKPASTGRLTPVIHFASSETSQAMTADTSAIGSESTGIRFARIASPSSLCSSSQAGK